jgi:predicted Zn finger-like uncharacterized protein
VIAACPQCQTRYRLAREKIGPQGARIRCSQCQTVFRVQAPPGAPPTPPEPKPSPVAPARAAPAPAAVPPPPPKPLPPLARALVAEVDADQAKAASELLALWRIEAELVDDGGEALIRMFRAPPALAVLGAELPSLGGARIAEIAQRASELAAVKLIRIATTSDQSGTPGFDAEEMLEAADFPAGLADILARLGIGQKPAPAPVASAPPAARPAAPPRPTPAAARPTPAVARPAPAAPAPRPAPASKPAAAPPVSSDPAIAAAERLARIAVSDVILYNQEKFAAAAARGTAAKELASELGEARQHFNSRVAPSVRDKRDFLVEEIERRAAALRGGS